MTKSYVSGFQMEEHIDVKTEEYFESNPWSVEDASVFLKYCCPECDYQIIDFQLFSDHALENHAKSNALFGQSKDVGNGLVQEQPRIYNNSYFFERNQIIQRNHEIIQKIINKNFITYIIKRQVFT